MGPDKLSIKTVMHPTPHTIGPKLTLKQALSLMHQHGIRHLPVQDGSSLVGILTERDIDFALRIEGKQPEEMCVKDAYIPDPYVTSPETPIFQVAAKMAHDHIGCALIAENGNLLGIFTTVDACRVLCEVLSGKREQ